MYPQCNSATVIPVLLLVLVVLTQTLPRSQSGILESDDGTTYTANRASKLTAAAVSGCPDDMPAPTFFSLTSGGDQFLHAALLMQWIYPLRQY